MCTYVWHVTDKEPQSPIEADMVDALCSSVYTYIYIYIYICMYAFVYIYLYTCVCVHTYDTAQVSRINSQSRQTCYINLNTYIDVYIDK